MRACLSYRTARERSDVAQLLHAGAMRPKCRRQGVLLCGGFPCLGCHRHAALADRDRAAGRRRARVRARGGSLERDEGATGALIAAAAGKRAAAALRSCPKSVLITPAACCLDWGRQWLEGFDGTCLGS